MVRLSAKGNLVSRVEAFLCKYRSERVGERAREREIEKGKLEGQKLRERGRESVERKLSGEMWDRNGRDRSMLMRGWGREIPIF